MKTKIFLLSFIFSQNFAISQTFSPMIIDTDAASDDFRAITMFLAIKELDIKAITTSDGALTPNEGLTKLRSLLFSLNRNIETAAGNEIPTNNPEWRGFCQKFSWGKELSPQKSTISAAELIIQKLEKSEKPLIIVCLGAFTNLYEVLKQKPSLESKIKKVIWYNGALNPLSDVNYETDKIAANLILNSNLIVDVVTNKEKKEMVLDESMLLKIKEIKTPFAEIIYNSYSVLENKTHPQILWDDIIPVYFLYSEWFDMEVLRKKPNQSIVIDFPAEEVKKMMLRILSQTYFLEKNIVFETFPTDKNVFLHDVAEISDFVIEKYGKDEWKAIILTNELHRHLGVYSIIGAKMGMKAREILNAEIDRIEVLSFAGSKPPLSCMLDGFQSSTGATLGFGTISLSTTSSVLPSAIFSYKGKKVKLTLKSKIHKEIENNLTEGILKYGNLTSGYWKLVRENALFYWKNLNRNEIFEIEEVK